MVQVVIFLEDDYGMNWSHKIFKLLVLELGHLFLNLLRLLKRATLESFSPLFKQLEQASVSKNELNCRLHFFAFGRVSFGSDLLVKSVSQGA